MTVCRIEFPSSLVLVLVIVLLPLRIDHEQEHEHDYELKRIGFAELETRR